MTPIEFAQSTSFLNIDLDILGGESIGELVSSFGNNVVVLHQSYEAASLELASQQTTMEETAIALSKLVRSLPNASLRLWKQCNRRVFNIGIQSGLTPHAKEFALSGNALSLLADIGVEVVITVYSPRLGQPPT